MNLTPFLTQALIDVPNQEDLLDPVILTRDEQIARDRANPYFDQSAIATKLYADITVEFQLGDSEGANVTIELIDTGNDEDGVIQYDADIHIGNNDSTGPKFMLCALAACLERFYALGLDKKFGTITGDW